MDRLTGISGEAVAENVVGKTITKMEMQRGTLVLRLEGAACPPLDMVVPVDMVGRIVLWFEDTPTKIDGQMDMEDMLAGTEAASMRMAKILDGLKGQCICGHWQHQHVDGGGGCLGIAGDGLCMCDSYEGGW